MWWPEQFATAYWHIWRWRNCFLHEKDFQIPWNAPAVITNYVECYRNTKNWNTAEKGEKKIIFVQWHPPTARWCKLNTDGVKTSEGRTGCGGVIRGDYSEWLRGFSMNLGECDVRQAKAWGIIEGLQLCWELGLKQVEVECDAKIIVEAISHGNTIEGDHVLFMRIKELIERDWRVEVKHI